MGVFIERWYKRYLVTKDMINALHKFKKVVKATFFTLFNYAILKDFIKFVCQSSIKISFFTGFAF